MKRLNTLLSLFTLCCFLNAYPLNAQKISNIEKMLGTKKTEWGLSSEDLSDAILKDHYVTLHNGLQHYYYTQRYKGIEVYNAVIGVHLNPEGQLQYATSRFVSALQDKVNTTHPAISAEQAILSATAHLGLDPKYDLIPIDPAGDKKLIFEAPGLSKSPIEARLVYQPTEQAVLLAWEIRIEPVEKTDDWNIRVDAISGAILQKDNWIIHCQFPGYTYTGPGPQQPTPEWTEATDQPHPKSGVDEALYHVFPLPVESPIHGARLIVSNPADPIASPFGWHDINGTIGPEYLITRGNNTHAYPDRGDKNRSLDEEPNGGENLHFDFPFNERDSMLKNLPAAVTQLFYTTNMVHDLAYHYGFDEAAGNFQETNYNNAGKGGDAVRAQAQNGADIDNPSLRNNANFSITPDGRPPVMQMYIWERSGGNFLRVEQPEAIAGLYQTGTAEFGPDLSETPLSGEVVLAFDNSDRPGKVCNNVINTAQVKGKIAMIDRGDCFFQKKVLNVETAGAIACVICNYEDTPLQMGKIDNLADPGIPSVILAYNDCQRIRRLIKAGVRINLQVPKDGGPAQLDSDFDNGIIVHEYTHGISSRLTGGPSTAGCINNDENLGEGWSDFFALVFTHPAQLNGRIARGIGNYVVPLDVNGRGIRRRPYSTDNTINDQTYDDIIGTSAPHDVGEIWAAVLWDMYWAFIDTYGWDNDIYTGNGGNNIALQLVVDGMKLQPCNPGFIDARDAILKADEINNGGANQCLIWEVFARRGLGWSAKQNRATSRNDGLQAFDVRPTCIQELKIAKTVTPNVTAGDNLQVELTITNHKAETATGIIVNDELGHGLSLVGGSVSGATDYELANNSVQMRISSLAPGTSLKISYLLRTDPGNLSYRLFLDNAEGRTNTKWTPASLAGNTRWGRSTLQSNSGTQSWYVEGTTSANDQALVLAEPLLVQGDQPILRFSHSYLIEPGQDGGFLQISDDGGQKWFDLTPELFFRSGYRGKLDAGTLAQPGIYAFWGASNGFINSYVDLSAYRDREILLRFRYSSDQEATNDLLNDAGWWIDDIEVFDMYNYQTAACLSSAQGDRACSYAPGRGAIVEPTERTTDIATLDNTPHTQIVLFPNPARELVSVVLRNLPAGPVRVHVLTADGRLLYEQNMDALGAEQEVQLPTGRWSPGVYAVQVQTDNQVLTAKLIVQ